MDIDYELLMNKAKEASKFSYSPFSKFAVGAAGYTLVQLTIRNTDMNFRQKRLHRFNIFSGMLCIAASALMFNDRKEWLVCLTIAVILQLYTAFVMPKAE